jgi:amino acid adenylation domain-containing protein
LIIASSGSYKKALELKDAMKEGLVINIDQDVIPTLFNVKPIGSSNSIAYILYTSGSTGEPKGVIHTHRNVLHFTRLWTNNLHINDNDRISVLSSYTFDSSVQDIYGALLNGATLFPYDMMQKGIEFLAAWIKENEISIVHTVPTLYRYFISTLKSAVFKNVRLVVLGGEATYTKDFEDFKKYFSEGAIFINGYGATESSINLQKFLNHHSILDKKIIPIGFAVDHTDVYILNENDQEADIHEKGEIVYKSDYLALGYWHKKEQTEKVFTIDPVTKTGRVYRSGDFGIRLPDGEIEFAGRKDDQVKIRGQRIELSEIERNIISIPGVEGVAVAIKNVNNEDRIVAYVQSNEKVSPGNIRDALIKILPGFMLPDFYMFIEKFPLTRTGKINRRALPNPDITNHFSKEYIIPDTEVEIKLADIWKELLQLDKVGIHDNFFELGGHSLLAIRLASAVRNKLQVEVTAREIFSFPTISQLEAHLQSPQNGLLLLPIEAVHPRPKRIPLSFSQEWWWFVDQLESSVQYHIPMVLRLSGKLNKEALSYALLAIVNRHEVLRTVIREEEGVGYQYIKDQTDWRLRFIDGSQYQNDLRSLQHHIGELIKEPFDLSKDDMLRAALISLTGEEQVLVVTMHHIASDGWSLSILAKELAALYGYFTTSDIRPPEPLAIQYADYALWQRCYLQGEILEKKINYWKNKLQAITPLQLPTDYPRPAVQSTRGALARFNIDKSVVASLQALSNEQGTTLYMTALAAFKVLLYRYSGQEDLCVGGVIAGRQQHEIENLIGCFINTLALRSEVKGEATFIELLQKLKATTLEAYEHQEVPIEKVVETVAKQRDQKHPLYQVMFIWHNIVEVPEISLGNVNTLSEGNTYNHNINIAQFDITFTITNTPHGLEGEILYSPDLYKSETIERMMEHFMQLLSSVIKEPFQNVGKLSMLTFSEEQQVIAEFNDCTVPYSSVKTVVELFEEQAAKTPDEIAIVFGEEQLTYQELNQRANQLAYLLKSKGLKENTLVPLCLERSQQMIVGILGILKAGGAYVPIDPEYPVDRIKYMVMDSQAALVVGSPETKSTLKTETQFDIIELESKWSAIHNQPVNNVHPNTQADQLAYMIYTSGSTGRPKGAAVRHQNLLNLLQWYIKEFSITGEDKNIIISSFAFDLTQKNIFSTLITGGTLILPAMRYYDNESIVNHIRQKAVTIINCAPNAFYPLVAVNTSLSDLNSLRLVVLGGEPIHLKHLENWILRDDYHCEIVNSYGPTECTDIAAFFRMKNPKDYINKTIPIGRANDNVKLFVLNKLDQLQPVGVAGEICIAGDGVGVGYLNDIELTAKKFIADPFSSDGESRLYKTGDLGRWLSDGNIEYLGRKDEQIKIRGYRIEPGEIEGLLRESGLVKEALVLAKKDSKGNDLLVGYIVCDEAINKEAIKDYLKDRLPEYMIPAIWVELDRLPQTPNGKIDKNALPEIDMSQLVSERYVTPLSEVEIILADIWKELLQLDKVSIHDNFFELGGHSLLVIRLVSAVRKNLQVEITVREIFSFPTISQLEAHLQLQQNGLLLPPIEAVHPRPTRIPLSFSQEWLWFIDQLEGSVQYHIPMVLRLSGELNKKVLESALQTIVLRHEILRTVIREEEGVGYQYIKEQTNWELNFVDGSHYQKDPQGLQDYIREVINKPFDLSKDNMLRAVLITLTGDEQVLVLTMHHIASDGWSLSIFTKELVALYSSYTTGDIMPLEPLAIQYTDYAIWQRNYLQGELLDKKTRYWKQKLKGVELLQLPTDYQRPSEWSSHGASLQFNINKLLTDELHALSKQEGATLFMTLLAAFKVLLQRYSGQEDICVGTPIANRAQKEIEGLIGFFVNTLALRSEVKADLSFKELLQQVKATTLEAYEHQDVPFEKVVEAVVKERDLSRNPLFQVMLAMQNTTRNQPLGLGEIQLLDEKYKHDTSHFDITFYVTETNYGLQGSVEYATDLYSEATISRMIGHFNTLLASIVKAPEQKIDELAILSREEEHQLLYEFNTTKAEYPRDKTILDLFEEQATRTPDSVAIVFEKEQLSYQQLNERANQLAHFLQVKGVKEETLVPICIERGFNMIIGILGILKAGGAYVPVDPDYPQERINYMLEDTAASIIISSKASRTKLQSSNSFEVIELDTDWSIIQKQPRADLQNNIAPYHLAYVIYTSGSTGKPKGVMIEHRNVFSFISWCMEEFSKSNFEIAYAGTSICFDLSIFEMFYPLIAGKRLRIIESGLFIGKYLPKDRNVLINSVPSVIQNLLNEETDMEHISALNMAGEPIPVQVQQALDADRIEIRNLYGPTEYTTYSTVHMLKKGEPVTIGHPITNTQIYIGTKEMKLAPVGLTGEICIGGEGLARGYLNRAELTAEKFISNPFSNEPEAKIYRTGDLGRWLPDGNIEYLGRKDDQVKIRGYRIELGEIESVLQQCEEISEGVVLAREDRNDNKVLIGYVVPKGPLNREAIKSYLHSKLPEYMIPAMWIELERLPLTLNGKIDKNALPEWDRSIIVNETYIAPRNEAESMLAKIWEEVLEIEKVGINNNFFELGGHSLIILKLVGKVRKLGLKIEVKDFFKYQTIEQQSNLISTSLKLFNAAGEGKFVIPIQSKGNNIPLFAIPEFLLYLAIGECINKQQPFYTIERSPFNDVKEIVNHYISEIKKIYPHGPYILAGYCNWGNIAIEMAQTLIAQGEQVPVLIFIEYYSSSIEISRTSIKFIGNKIKFIINKLKNSISFTDKRNFFSEELKYALKYFKKQITGSGLKNFKSAKKTYTGKVILFQASETYGFKNDSHMGWKNIFTGEVNKYIIKGEHLNIMNGSAAAQIAEILNEELKPDSITKHIPLREPELINS